MEFPYGKAPLAILVLAVASGAYVLIGAARQEARRPQIVYATFTKEHAAAYRSVIGPFEKKHGVTVQFQVVEQRALQGRLQSALQVGAAVPDMVELLDGTMGVFTKGPTEGVGFVDLTDRVKSSGLYDSLVASRFKKWSSRDRIFALPHDVHPVMLAYRRDIVERLGIDVNKLTTWDEFSRVGRDVSKIDKDGSGVPDHYMIDMPTDGGDALRLLLVQRGGNFFSAGGDVTFDSEEAADVICWYVKQIQGPGRIAFPCGWGQNLSKAMLDGLCLFYICPDWRTAQFEADVASLSGKLALMPLPAWEPGGRRTSTWGGTGLAITKQCRDVELAWELAMYLYYQPEQLGPRFAITNILPPLKTAWELPQFSEPRPFYSGIRLGRAYAELALQVPAENDNPYTMKARDKFSEAFTNASIHYAEHGEDGLREYVRAELHRSADRLREAMSRSVFLNAPEPQLTAAGEGSR
jgi:arabinosaccharide transport system substrate-binding protein